VQPAKSLLDVAVDAAPVVPRDQCQLTRKLKAKSGRCPRRRARAGRGNRQGGGAKPRPFSFSDEADLDALLAVARGNVVEKARERFPSAPLRRYQRGAVRVQAIPLSLHLHLWRRQNPQL